MSDADKRSFYSAPRQKRFLRGGFLLSLVVECALILMLPAGKSETSPQPLSAEEAARYAQYSISLPGKDGCEIDAASVLALCTVQDEQRVGGRLYRSYTSDVLPQYLSQCDRIREITETGAGTVYIGYKTWNEEEVVFTVGSEGILERGIYVETTDTYYSLSESENYKLPHFRSPPAAAPIIRGLAVGLGAVLVLAAAGETRTRRRLCPRFAVPFSLLQRAFSAFPPTHTIGETNHEKLKGACKRDAEEKNEP